MSDEEVQTKAPAKRGRKPNPEKAAPKKETAVAKVKNGDEGDAPPAKRGRGRPKGSGAKKTKETAKTNGTTKPAAKGRRGRPKKEEKKEESSADEENGKSSAEDEEDEEDE
ncbi:hypothetical protein ABEB36_009470 [Hypothenemus hampei]|uniref:Uncharacterized protein n=1 Tax=Hypothenemus hampei TaxID=57062 RepID=A0ABD1EGQ2_HYPHA